MFYECKSLSSLNLSNFNTQNVTDMSDMFRWCESLSSINLSNLNTQNVTNMSFMFEGCSNILLSLTITFSSFKDEQKQNILFISLTF